MRSRRIHRLSRPAAIASPRAPLRSGRRTRPPSARPFRTRPRSTPRKADRWREGTLHRPRWRGGFSARRSPGRDLALCIARTQSPLLSGWPAFPRVLELRGARGLQLRFPALQAGQDSPAPGRDAFAEFLRVGPAFLAHPLGFLRARLRGFAARGGKLGLVRLHAFRDRAPPRLDVAAEFLDVACARAFASLLGERAGCHACGEERDCHRDECFCDRHGASWIVLLPYGAACCSSLIWAALAQPCITRK